MPSIHNFEERLLPKWWHQSSRALKVILVVLALGILRFVQEFPHLSLVTAIAIAVLIIFIAAVGASLKWIFGQFR